MKRPLKNQMVLLTRSLIMNRWLPALLLVAGLTVPAQGHFIWISPAEKNTVQVVFSDDAQPDEAVPVTKIAKTKLFLRTVADEKPLPMTLKKDHYSASVPANEVCTVGGVCEYGVLDKGDGPFLLTYTARATTGGTPVEIQK